MVDPTSIRRLIFVAILLAVAMPGAGAAPSVEILSPKPGVPLLDRLSVVFAIEGVERSEIASAEVLLDGTSVETLTAPPWLTTSRIDFTLEPRQIEVRVTLTSGEVVNAVRETPAVEIDKSIDIRRVNLVFNVFDDAGRPVMDVRPEEVEVYDGRHETDIERWGETDEGLSVVLVVDASHSMRGDRIDHAVAAAQTFVDTLEDRDLVGLVVFNEEIYMRSAPSEDFDMVRRKLSAVEAEGGTALYDALHAASSLLARAPADTRRVAVVLSDGRDAAVRGWKRASDHDLEEAIRGAHMHDVVIYTLGLGEGVAWERSIDQPGTTEDVLRKMASSTGGRFDVVTDAADLEAAYARVLRELRHQYSLIFEPREPVDEDEEWREIRIEVDRRDVRVRAREGYFVK